MPLTCFTLSRQNGVIIPCSASSMICLSFRIMVITPRTYILDKIFYLLLSLSKPLLTYRNCRTFQRFFVHATSPRTPHTLQCQQDCLFYAGAFRGQPSTKSSS